jgi:muconolactone D-isomerase
MLVLFRGELKCAMPGPVEQMFELCGKQVTTLMGYKQEGKILAGGIIAGKKGSYAIFDVQSIEELQGLIAQMPLFPYMECELTPLISYETARAAAKQLAEGA